MYTYICIYIYIYCYIVDEGRSERFENPSQRSSYNLTRTTSRQISFQHRANWKEETVYTRDTVTTHRLFQGRLPGGEPCEWRRDDNGSSVERVGGANGEEEANRDQTEHRARSGQPAHDAGSEAAHQGEE